MKEWNEATIVELDVQETAFGPYSPEKPDSEKTQVTRPDGEEGWEQFFGEGENSSTGK